MKHASNLPMLDPFSGEYIFTPFMLTSFHYPRGQWLTQVCQPQQCSGAGRRSEWGSQTRQRPWGPAGEENCWCCRARASSPPHSSLAAPPTWCHTSQFNALPYEIEESIYLSINLSIHACMCTANSNNPNGSGLKVIQIIKLFALLGEIPENVNYSHTTNNNDDVLLLSSTTHKHAEQHF